MTILSVRHTLQLIVILLLLQMSWQSHARTEYESGWDHFQAGNFALARTIWSPLAEQGDGDAALGLAIIYEKGLQTTRDTRQSARWYQIAADQGIAEAQHDLGIKYFTGTGVTKSYERAYQLWKQAAETGLGAAQTKLAYLYLQGLGTGKDTNEALRWYRQAANQNNTEGMYNLSLMYKGDTGIKANSHQFRYWLEKAAELDYPRAQYDLGLMMLHGKGMERSVSGGKNWLIKAANNGLVNAQYYLGTLYMNGHILRPDKENALKLLTLAAKQGHKGAQQALIDIQTLEKNKSDQPLSASSKKQPQAMTKAAGPTSSPGATILNNSLLDGKTTSSMATPVSTGNQTDWLLQQDGKKFTIQLIASQDEAGIQRYLKQLPSHMNPFIYQFNRNNKPWMAVATGIYDSHDAATNAIKALPAKIRKAKPWVRNVGVLKNIIATQ